MRRLLFALALLCLVGVAEAQNADVTVGWVLPTKNSDGTNIPATGAGSLTKIQIWLAPATIPATTAALPTTEVTPVGSTTSQTIAITFGGTVFVRLKACNASTCSDFTTEVSAPVPVKPGVPTSVTIQVRVT